MGRNPFSLDTKQNSHNLFQRQWEGTKEKFEN